MTRTGVYALAILGLLAAPAAEAAFTFTEIYVQQNYFQSGGTTYVPLMSSPLAGVSNALGANGPGGNAKIEFGVGLQAPTDFTSITVSGTGFGSPQPLGAPFLDENGEYRADYIDFDFPSLAALNVKYPLGSAYTFSGTAANPALNQTRNLTYDVNRLPTSSPGGPELVPLLTALSYTGLNGLNVASPYLLGFNTPFFGNGCTAAAPCQTNLEFAIFDTSVFVQGPPFHAIFQARDPATTQSLLLPAHTLAANAEYAFLVGYDVSGRNNVEFETFTFGEFTTGAAVPEPATLALLGISVAGLAASRRRKQQ